MARVAVDLDTDRIGARGGAGSFGTGSFDEACIGAGGIGAGGIGAGGIGAGGVGAGGVGAGAARACFFLFFLPRCACFFCSAAPPK